MLIKKYYKKIKNKVLISLLINFFLFIQLLPMNLSYIIRINNIKWQDLFLLCNCQYINSCFLYFLKPI